MRDVIPFNRQLEPAVANFGKSVVNQGRRWVSRGVRDGRWARSLLPFMIAMGTAADQHLQNVETIASLRAKSEETVNLHQRGIERLTAVIGRPRTVYLIVTFVVTWVAWNMLAPERFQIDPAPFFFLQGIVGFLALLMMTFVLTTQNRQGKLAEQRAHLDLQINLLSEQKAAKIIALLEELRHDLPNVRDRVDKAAEVMKEAADPSAVLLALEHIESSEESVRGNK
jgi:uncharacterized membrane protein